jgi:hypothetical protein
MLLTGLGTTCSIDFLISGVLKSATFELLSKLVLSSSLLASAKSTKSPSYNSDLNLGLLSNAKNLVD